MDVLWTSLRRSLFLLVAILALGIGLEQANAGQDTHERLMASFDFEERITADWSHLFLQEPSLPPKGLFFSATGDTRRFVNGAMSLRLDLHGGSISYRTAEHVIIPARKNARYMVRAWVMTEGLKEAAARVEVRVVDQSRLAAKSTDAVDPILEATIAEFASGPIRTQGKWQLVEVLLDTRSEAARGGGELQIIPSLQVVQPGFIAPVDHGRLTPRVEDVAGFAWFDDLQVWRIPSVDFMVMSSKTNLPSSSVSVEGENLFARVMIDDPIEATPAIEIQVLDLDGVVAHRDRFTVVSDGRPVDRELPELGPGWYEVRMRALGDGEVIAQSVGSILVVHDRPRHRDRSGPHFGYSFQDWSTSELSSLQRFLEVLDPGVVEFSMWPVGNDDAPVEHAIAPMQQLLESQRSSRREVLFALDRVHASIAKKIDVEPSEIAVVFNADASTWMPEVEQWLLAFGGSVDQWRIASPDEGTAIKAIPSTLENLVNELVVEPSLAIPVGIESPCSGAWPYLVAGPEHDAGVIEAVLTAEDSGSVKGITVLMESPSSGWSRRDRVQEMSHRLISAWKNGAKQILSSVPKVGSGIDATSLAWACLGNALSSRRLKGELYVSNFATCLIADGDAGLLVIAYANGVDRTETIELPLGTSTVSVESIDGTKWAVANANGVHHIEVTSMPVVIRDADSEIVSLASSMRFSPQRIRSMRGARGIELVARNPYPHVLDGEIEFIAPDGWRFEPARQKVRIGAHAEARVPTTIRWDGIPELGSESIQVKLTMSGGGQLDARVQLPIDVVSPGIEIAADCSVVTSAVSGKDSVLLTVEVTNTGEEAMNLEAVAVAWRAGRERALISNLQPQETAIRRFEFKAGLDRLDGTEVLLSLHEVDGAAAVAIRVPISRQSAATALVPGD